MIVPPDRPGPLVRTNLVADAGKFDETMERTESIRYIGQKARRCEGASVTQGYGDRIRLSRCIDAADVNESFSRW